MISLAHRTIFVHVPKCGGQSVEEAFCEDLGLDWNKPRHRSLLLMQARPEGQKSTATVRFLAHLPAREYVSCGYVPQPLWDAFFTFAIVRNPFSRVESMYFYTGSDKKMDFGEFVTRANPNRLGNFRYRPQVDFLADDSGQLCVSKIYRLEALSDAWADIRQRSGVKTSLPHRNRSKRESVTWTEEMRDHIRNLYRADFERLGYDLETGAPLSPGA